jgi:hypothetical protein
MSSDDYARGLHGKLLAECEQRNTVLRAEVERLKVEVMVAARVRPRREENERARALISWIDGMCVDEADHMEIRAAINRYHEAGGRRAMAKGYNLISHEEYARLKQERDDLRAALKSLYDATEDARKLPVSEAVRLSKARTAAGVVLSGGNE